MILLRMTLIFFLALNATAAQRRTAEQHRRELSDIRQEIADYKDKIKNEEVREKSMLEMLSSIDREIDLTQALLHELKSEDERNAREILEVRMQLAEKLYEIERLQKIYSDRLVHFYKFGRIRDVELLLSAQSFNQVMVWMKYQKLLAENDKRNYHNILEKKKIIESNKDRLKEEILSSRKLIDEKVSEQKNLNQKKMERETLLQKVRQNKQVYLGKLKEYEQSAKEVERLITVREEKRIAKGTVEQTDFPGLQGRMIWPTRGELITKFGRYKHPKLKTITENIGIDIRAGYGDDVRSVGRGIVTAITWQRGRGNIVIINHFGGYYTVYTHLSKILVQVNDSVNTGDVIGEVGESGSLSGPVLHFEIWKNNRVLNPMKWLS